MPKQAIVVHDSLDDRKEIVLLLERLPPAIRLAWLQDCCKHASGLTNKNSHPEVKQETIDLAARARWDSAADQMLTRECYSDIWFIATQWDFDIDVALAKLVRLAKKHGKRLV